jgi:hypothetical protein
MIIDKEGGISIVFQENTSLPGFLQNFQEAYPGLRHENLIINLFSFSGLTPAELLMFLELSDNHRANKKSFVLVTNKVSYEDVPEELLVVPTLQEAKDLIEMEEIERDLEL